MILVIRKVLGPLMKPRILKSCEFVGIELPNKPRSSEFRIQNLPL